MSRKKTKTTLRMRGFFMAAEGEIIDGKLNLTKFESKTFGVCSVCGCTDDDCSQCIEVTGEPCRWVNDDHTLCSRCVQPANSKEIEFEVVQTITRHAKQLAPGTRFKIERTSSRVHVDRWLSQGRIREV